MIFYLLPLIFFTIIEKQILADSQPGITTSKLNLEDNKEKHILQFGSLKDINGKVSTKFLEKILDVFKPDVFIETGTFLGDTSFKAAKVFKNVHTIEASDEIYKKAKVNLECCNNVTMHLGDSGNVLKDLLPNLKGKIVFWLDGHYSGIHEGHQTALTPENPLIKELAQIKNSKLSDSIIMIDDIRFCDPAFTNMKDPIIGGYPLISEICKKLHEINNNYRFLIMGDVLIAYPHQDNIVASNVLQACTLSRFFDGSNIEENFILNLETKFIANVDGEEKDAIELLNNTFGSDLHSMKFGVGNHYILWHALLLLKQKDYANAYKRLRQIKKNGFKHWRIHFYLSQAAFGLNHIDDGLKNLKKINKKISKIAKENIIVKESLHFFNIK